MTRKELADAMLKGKRTPSVKECEDDYVSLNEETGICTACALGAALIGKHDGDIDKARRLFWDALNATRRPSGHVIAADLLGIPAALADEVERMHVRGRSIKEIAAWLTTEALCK